MLFTAINENIIFACITYLKKLGHNLIQERHYSFSFGTHKVKNNFNDHFFFAC